ncbi:gephyrin-like molybdotransferase Glp [Paenibacillus turpanensis]|uniref:molybdopterin molybdotransferase MoeA n=1 Tax=Paenibacillus turpanensis TaxID=2689078 RepID=UPI00140D57BB|nr:gephyrin-like molybdotransferase Glp [Paenibacillus turpanensis]
MSGDEKWRRRFQRKAVSVEEARRLILQYAAVMDAEQVRLEQSFGRVCAERVAAAEPVPHFRRSGMDGYAVRAEDLAGATPQEPALLRVIESVPCGTVPALAITPGTAAKIMTGAMVPEGADAVVMIEMTELAGHEAQAAAEAGGRAAAVVAVKKPVPAGANVSAVGSDHPAGELLLAAGARIGAAEAALLASAGRSTVAVYRRPRIGILSTGTELLPIDAPLAPGKIRNSNAYMIAAQVRSAGGEPVIGTAVSDEPAALSESIEQLLESCDAVITTGGVSVGDYDILTDYLHEWSGTLLFTKVMMRPGSPTSAGVHRGKLLFALSGNPGACFAGFELLVRPALQAMLGSAAAEPSPFSAILAADFPKVNAYPRYIRGRSWIEQTAVYVEPMGADQSSRMYPGKGADCFIMIPPGGSGLPKGTVVSAIRIQT